LQRLFLLYHELRPEKAAYSYVVECAEFNRHLQLFVELQDHVPEVLQPSITFDDGHVSNYDYALPMLEAAELKAHFFITVGWTANKPGYMNWTQLAALQAAGNTVGAHGWTHSLLTHCSDSELDRELRGARHALEDKLGSPVTTMSLPGGRFNDRVLRACEAAGYLTVFTSVPRAEPAASHSLTLGRLNIRGDMTSASIRTFLEPRNPALRKLGRQYRLKQSAQSVLGDDLYARLWSILNRQEASSQQDRDAVE